MSRHKLKAKKVIRHQQWPASKYLVRSRYNHGTPVSHHAEDREGWCRECLHPWAWHDNVVLKVDLDGNTYSPVIRCRGGDVRGLSMIGCTCRETYPR